VTKRGKVILVETKGDHFVKTSTVKKRSGNLWGNKAGNDYRYYMFFETKDVVDANTLAYMANKNY
jgi:type III restriction enzyme